MSYGFVAYIDESGDEGFVFHPDGGGSSRWIVLSALVMRKENDMQVVKVVKEARQLFGKPDKHPLHFRDLKHDQRVALARMIGQMSSRTVSVLVHKPSIPEPENFQQEAYSLYHYASRLLLERVSWLCRDHRRKQHSHDGLVELIYSNRSAMSYDALRSYLEQLRGDSAQKEIRIDWSVVEPANVKAVNHDQLAGLQLADAVATSAFYSVTPNRFGDVEDRYLRLIGNTVYRHEGRVEGYGLKFWCADKALYAHALDAVKIAP